MRCETMLQVLGQKRTDRRADLAFEYKDVSDIEERLEAGYRDACASKNVCEFVSSLTIYRFLLFIIITMLCEAYVHCSAKARVDAITEIC